MLSSVAAPSNPPKVMIGAKQAKYMKNKEAIHCTSKPSL